MASMRIAPTWANRSTESLLLNLSLAGMVVAALYAVAKMGVLHISDLLDRVVWESSSIDLMVWTIGSRGQGALIIPLVSCIFLTMSRINDDSLSRVVAYGSRGRYAMSRVVDAMVVSLLVSLICFMVWFAVVLSEGESMINWGEKASFYFGQTLLSSKISAVTSFGLFYICLLMCSLYASLCFVSIEMLLESTAVSSVCIMFFSLVGYFLPWINEYLGILPDLYILTSEGFPLSWLVPPMACFGFLVFAVGFFRKKDFLLKSRIL